MKNTFNFKSFMAVAGIASLIWASSATAVSAQTKSADGQTRQVRLKIITEENGKQTMRDTIMEITGDLKLPDLKELEKWRTQFSGTNSLGSEKIIFRQLSENHPLVHPGDTHEGKSTWEKGKIKTLRPTEPEKYEQLTGKPEPGQIKIYRQANPANTSVTDSVRQKKLYIFRNEGIAGQNPEFGKLSFNIHELPDIDPEEIRNLLPLTGDSLLVFKRVIIVHENLTEPEKQLLNRHAAKEAPVSNLKDLELSALDLYPNPNSGIFNLSFEVAKKSHTTLTVLDAVGREMYKEDLKNFKGRYQKEIDLSHLSKGMYFLQVKQGKHVFNKKIILQ
jgi:hypothetical protein